VCGRRRPVPRSGSSRDPPVNLAIANLGALWSFEVLVTRSHPSQGLRASAQPDALFVDKVHVGVEQQLQGLPIAGPHGLKSL
jgi:hypothetical protein